MKKTIEINFDGLVGPTHNFAGLSQGNVASLANENAISSPKRAALQGLDKMRRVRALGVTQAVLPPHMRPHLATLRRLGFAGEDDAMVADAAARDPRLFRMVSSASAMWTANAATMSPAADATDGRMHLVPANLRHMFHRTIEAETTRDVLGAIFRDSSRFVVHEPLPGGEHFADEGAANHTRLRAASGRVAHLFGWGRSAFEPAALEPKRFPARQTREASESVARLLALRPDDVVLAQQHPRGIDAGAFHTDVVAVGNENFLMLHELAFVDAPALVARLSDRLGGDLAVVLAREDELPVADAVAAYPFNSQVLSVERDGRSTMVVVAPVDAEENPRARRFLERVVAEDNPVSEVIYLDVRQSMRNGGGPACLRQRVQCEADDVLALGGRVILDEALERDLRDWIERNYRDTLVPRDLADPSLWRETMRALDELTRILRLGHVYEFQR